MKKYIMNRVILLLALFLLSSIAHSQVIVKDTLPPAFEWSLHLFDLHYMVDAAKTEAIRVDGGDLPQAVTPKAGNYGNFYRNLSMKQTTEMARNLHGSLYYGHNVLWNKLIEPVSTKL